MRHIVIAMGILLLPMLASAQHSDNRCTKENITRLQNECEQNNCSACRELGYLYYVLKKNNSDCSVDDVKAAEFNKRACDLGCYNGCNALASMYFHGRGVAKDYNKAVELYKIACENNIVEACYNLGEVYRVGQIKGTKNINYPDKAAIFYKQACDSDDKSYYLACYRLGLMYVQGRGVTKDFNEATRLFDKCCDETIGLSNCCNQLHKLRP